MKLAMKKIIYLMTLVGLMSIACTKESGLSTPHQSDDKVFRASFESTLSKALLKPSAETSKVEWQKNDEVSILVGDSQYLYKADADGAATTLVPSEESAPESGTAYGLYPYDVNAKLSENVVSTTLPGEQTAIKGSFSTHLSVAEASANGDMDFKNVCGLIWVKVDSDNVTRIELKGNKEEIVAGSINVTVTAEPSYEPSSENNISTVVLVPVAGNETIEAGDYYFAVLPQKFEQGFTITAYKNDGYAVVRKVSVPVELKRSGMLTGKSFGISGSGTESDPYLLKTSQDMCDMRTLAKVNSTTYFRLENDIDMADVKSWTPINYDEDFTRQIHFDGNDKTISNFAPETFEGNYFSIFGVLYGSCKDLTISNVNIDVDAGTVGVLGGYVGTGNGAKPATVTNVHISGVIKATGDNVGGFGGATRGCTLSGCTSEVNVTGKVNVGGFIGVAQNVTSTFEKCHYNGESTSTGNALGGICGGTNSGAEFIFRQCWVEGTLSSTGRGTAGIVGNSPYARIENCYSTAAVSNNNQSVGGLVGVAEGNLVVTKSYCSGSATGRRAVGGIVGYTSKADDKTVSITDCIAWNPSVTASRTNTTYSSGAVVGYAAATCTLKGCYYKSDMTFKDNSYTLSDTEDVESGQPQSPINDYYSPYHGKSSNGKTLSELAGALGWDSAIWDLTTMTLK